MCWIESEVDEFSDRVVGFEDGVAERSGRLFLWQVMADYSRHMKYNTKQNDKLSNQGENI